MGEKTKKMNLSFQKYLRQRSSDYQQYGRYMARPMTYGDTWTRFLSFLGDVIVMVFPIFIWDFIFLLTTAGYVSYTFFDTIRVLVGIMICITIVVGNAYLMMAFKGQSFGKIAMDLKVVDSENRELSNATLLIRELVGRVLPILITYFGCQFIGVNQIVGIVALLFIMGIVVCVDKQHRNIIDFILKTKIVVLNEKGKKASFVPVQEKVKEEKVKPAENKYDLHVYSSFSHDGEEEVEDILKKAKKAGVNVLSICDHNCAKANVVAQKIASLYNIEYITGINIDCEFKGSDIRMLGYFINPNDERFMQVEYESLAKEKAVSLRRVQLFEAFTGFEVNQEKILKSNRFQIISCEMIARQILSNTEYRKTKLLQPYLTGNKREKPITNFIQDFFGKKGPAYVSVAHPKVEDMIALIKAAGGVPVLAHPMRSLGNEPELIEEVIRLGVKGIEIFTPYHTHQDMKYLIPIAKKYDLDITAGSEYHGEGRTKFVLGRTYCPKDVEVVIANFVDKYRK